ncbi:unnamed protein product [Arctogadus glacialis]
MFDYQITKLPVMGNLITIIAGLSHQLFKLLLCACAKQSAAHTHTARANAYIHRKHAPHTQMRTNIHGNAHKHMHTNTQAHTARQDKGSDTFTEAHTHMHTHTPYIKTKAATHSPS